MTLEIDPTEPLRRPADLRRLVEAIVAAEPEDEQDWLEWKSTLDLTSKAGQFAIGRTILGMANRDPARAARHVGGLGYLVVGASHGGAQGVTATDPADLDNWISRYAGSDGPQWWPTFLRIGHANVLVIIVEAPAQGDPIHTLRKSFQGGGGATAEDGAIFVRHGSKTQRANSADIAILTSRAAASSTADGPPVDVAPLVTHLARIDEAAISTTIADALEHAVAGRMRAAASVSQQPGSPFVHDGTNFLTSEYRTRSQYAHELEGWARKAKGAVWRHALSRLATDGVGQLALRLTNRSPHHLSRFEVVVEVPRASLSLVFDDAGPPTAVAPLRPRPYGEGRRTDSIIRAEYLEPLDVPRLRPAIVVEFIEDVVRLRYDGGLLRAEEQVVTAPAFLFLAPEHEGTTLAASWRATSVDVGGVRRGSFELELGAPVDTRAAARRGLEVLRD